mmetsp:Transcript_11994/g.24515  ORF Transcript_11994/g.24515 Transcript_11994/m.24515 type:complete len:244 (-) Transcript_11994:19-750(-)
MSQGRSFARTLWVDAQSPNATIYTKLRPYLYELCILDLTLYVTSVVSYLYLLADGVLLLLRSLRDFARDKKTRRFVRNNRNLLVAVLMYTVAFSAIHLLYGHGNLMFIITCLSLIYVYGFENPNTTVRKKRRISAYSVFNNGFKMLGDLDAGALVAQFTTGIGSMVGVAGGEGGVGQGQGDDEGEKGDEVAGVGVAEGRGVGGGRKRNKKKDKKSCGRKKELEARRDRQMQRLLARDDELLLE